jgi:hypothetical protein
VCFEGALTLNFITYRAADDIELNILPLDGKLRSSCLLFNLESLGYRESQL